ncbi:MAG: ABC transporter substrate-binding protein [Candidatus Hodarchaeota archaeon]
MLKKIVILLMGVLVFGIGSIAPGKVWGDIVKIGAIWELTGPGASWGLPCKKMVDFQAYEVNTRGGINIAGKKYLVEFITEDGKCTAADGVTSAKKLVFRDKVKHIVGPVCSASCAAIVPTIEENKVLMMTVSCGTDKFFSSKTKYAFRTYPPGYPLIPAFLGWAVDKRKDLKKVAFFNPNDEAGKMVVKWGLPKLDEIEKGNPGRYENVGVHWYERGTEDFRPSLVRVMRKSPDVIVTVYTPAEAAMIIKQSRELGYKGTFFSCGGVNTPYVAGIAGKENCEGVMGYGMDWDVTPQMKKLYQGYKAYHGEEPLDIAGQALDGFPLMVRAMEEAGSFDPDEIVKVLESWKTVKTYYGDAYWGGLKTYGVNHQICRPWPLIAIRDGKSVLVDTPMAHFP